MKWILVAAALPLCGCVATSGANWHHVEIHDAAASERQFVIDNGHCRQVSVGAAPMPTILAAEQDPTGYEITAQTTTTGPGGTTYGRTRGTITPRSTGGFASGMAGGVAQGAALRQQIDARRAEGEIYRGCMYRLGWSDGQG